VLTVVVWDRSDMVIVKLMNHHKPRLASGAMYYVFAVPDQDAGKPGEEWRASLNH
jgi:hypothetical protein